MTLFSSLLRNLVDFPWRSTLLTLYERFREDRLGLTASSLTFTTTIALVPLVTVALAVFTAFPMFAKFQDVLQKWLIESLVPDSIARQVLGYLTQFAGKASKLGVAGVAILFVTALALVFTIDRTLNAIWRVRRSRPFGQRVLVYWAALTLGPLLLGASLTMTSYAITASRSVVGALPGGVQFLLELIQFVLMAAGVAALYRYVPNTQVRWGHAWVGGLFVSAGFELAKRLLGVYLSKVPTYSVVYGAFATVPILLVWIYMAWLMVLFGAVITAYLPSLLAGLPRRAGRRGWAFELALEATRLLAQARGSRHRGLSLAELAQGLHVETQQLEPSLEALMSLDWVGLLQEDGATGGARHVLLVDPAHTPLEPLMAALLLTPSASNRKLWENGRFSSLRLVDAL